MASAHVILKDGCQWGRKVVPRDSKSDLPLACFNVALILSITEFILYFCLWVFNHFFKEEHQRLLIWKLKTGHNSLSSQYNWIFDKMVSCQLLNHPLTRELILTQQNILVTGRAVNEVLTTIAILVYRKCSLPFHFFDNEWMEMDMESSTCFDAVISVKVLNH